MFQLDEAVAIRPLIQFQSLTRSVHRWTCLRQDDKGGRWSLLRREFAQLTPSRSNCRHSTPAGP